MPTVILNAKEMGVGIDVEMDILGMDINGYYSPRWILLNRGNPSHNIRIPPDNPRINGWSTFTPFDWAIAPTANGSTAAPPPPKAAANPIELTCKCRGKSFVVTTTTAGNSGPRKKP